MTRTRTFHGFLRSRRGGHQLRYDQAFHVDPRVVRTRPGLLAGLGNRAQVVEFVGICTVLVERLQRIEGQEGIVRNDAARRLRPPDVHGELVGLAQQPRADLEVAEQEDAVLLDALRLAMRQAAAVAGADAVAAGVGQVERAVAIADPRMLLGQVPLAIGNRPVALTAAADEASVPAEGLAAQLRRYELLGAEHFQYQFHEIAPCGHLPRLTACGSPSGR